MPALKSSADSFIQVLVLLQLAYRREIDKSTILALLEDAKSGAADFAKKHRIKAGPFAEAIKLIKAGKPLADADRYPSGRYAQVLKLINSDLNARKKWLDDPEMTPNQVQVAKPAKQMFAARDAVALERCENALEPKLHFLENQQIRLIYTPTFVGRTQPVDELKYLVKKLTGNEGEIISADDAVHVRAKDPDRYKHYLRLRGQYTQVYKAALRDMVRNSGKKHLPIPLVRRQMQAQNIKTDALPRELDPFEISEDSKLYYKGRLIQGYPAPNFATFEVSTDPNSDYVFKYTMPGEGKKPIYGYYDQTKRENKEAKSELVMQAMDELPNVRPKWVADLLQDTDKDKKIMGTLAELLYSHAMRIGDPNNKTKNEDTYGLSTLRKKDVRIYENGTIKFTYPGKKSAVQTHVVKPGTPENDAIIFVTKKMWGVAKTPNDTIFKRTAKEINEYVTSLGSPVTAHKFRDVKATKLVQAAMKKKKLPRGATQAQAEKFFKDVLCLPAAKQLGHHGTTGKTSPHTVIKAYLHPDVGIEWFKSHNLRVPAWLQLGQNKDEE